MKAATHRGNCQVCGHQQHVMADGLANHGYTVQFGFFKGTCRGSSKQPVQVERTITDATIDALHDYAAGCDAAVRNLKTGVSFPSRILTGQKLNRTTYKYEDVHIAFADGTQAQQTRAIELAIMSEESDARGARGHAKGLKEMANRLHGTALVLIDDMVKAAPAPKATVDVKAAKVTGAFGSKAARKDELDKLNRVYERQIDALQAIFLAVPHDARTQEQTDVYYAPHNLCNWRPKHSAAALKVFPQAKDIVTAIEELVAAREAVKAAP